MIYTYTFSNAAGTATFEYVSSSPISYGSTFGPSNFKKETGIELVHFNASGDDDWIQVNRSYPVQDVEQYLFKGGSFKNPGINQSFPAAAGIGTLTLEITYTYVYEFSTPAFNESFRYSTDALVTTPLTLSNGTAGFSESGCDSVVLDRQAVYSSMGPAVFHDTVTINNKLDVGSNPNIVGTYIFPPGAFSQVGTYQPTNQPVGTLTITAT